MTDQGGAGKGDTYRKVDVSKYNENFESIFGKKMLNNTEDSRPQETNDKGGD
jgi:hypothetical protein